MCGRKRMVSPRVSTSWHQVRACVLSGILAGPMHWEEWLSAAAMTVDGGIAVGL